MRYFIAIIIALFLIAGCQPKEVVDVPTSIQCEVEEEYTVQVPYNETEFYYIKEGVGRATCSEEQYTDFDMDISPLGSRCQIKVINNGNITGEWTIKAKFITTNSGGGPESEPLTKEIAPQMSAIFDYTYDGSDIPKSCTNVNIKTPSVELCKYTFYQDVRKSRTVTKFKEEVRTRMVNKPCE